MLFSTSDQWLIYWAVNRNQVPRVLIVHKLKFSSQCQLSISKTNQRLYIVRRLKSLGASSALIAQLYSSFIESHIFYCLIIFYSNLSSSHKKALRKLDNQVRKLIGDPNSVTQDQMITTKTTSYAWKIFTDQQHFIHHFLNRLPSGRLQVFKYRATAGPTVLKKIDFTIKWLAALMSFYTFS